MFSPFFICMAYFNVQVAYFNFTIRHEGSLDQTKLSEMSEFRVMEEQNARDGEFKKIKTRKWVGEKKILNLLNLSKEKLK